MHKNDSFVMCHLHAKRLQIVQYLTYMNAGLSKLGWRGYLPGYMHVICIGGDLVLSKVGLQLFKDGEGKGCPEQRGKSTPLPDAGSCEELRLELTTCEYKDHFLM